MSPAASDSRRILLVDDHAPFRRTLAELLRAVGHTVVEAEAGCAGIACLHQGWLDLVVTDRDMPGMTGWDVAELIKAAHPRMPVILMTGSIDNGSQGRPRREHVDAVLAKPFPAKALFALIARLTGSGRQLRPIGHGTA